MILRSFRQLQTTSVLIAMLYCTPLGFVNLGSARQSKIEASQARVSNEEHPSQIGKGDEEDRFCKAAASPNPQNLTACSISISAKNSEGESFVSCPAYNRAAKTCSISSKNLSRIQINNSELTIELAATPEKREQGLMGRSSLLEDEGMLFIFDKPRILSFWMKNTTIPLSIGFFDENRRLINIEDMDPPKSGDLNLYKSHKPAQYALEVSQGWFDRHQISPSMRFENITYPQGK